MREGEQITIAGLAAAYATGAASVAAVAESVLAAVAADRARHAWISLVPAAQVQRRAADLDALPAARRGELHGIPFAVKDNIDTAGLPTTAACPDFSYLPERDATAVARLLAAGALLVGKTNLDQFATGLTGARSPYGTCESVLLPGSVSGGSSSGSAVAVAAGHVAFSLGTDTAGSGRVPAALNGIVGLKPTRGLVSTAGVVPACASLDCVSVFAHSLADAEAVLAVIAGPDHADPWSRRGPVAPVVAAPRTVRLGVLGRADLVGNTGVLKGYEAACLRAAGVVAATVRIDLAPFLEAGSLLYEGPWVAERLAGLVDFLDSHPDSVLPVTRAILDRGRGVTAVEAFRGQHRLAELRAVVDRVWEDVDALLLPTVGTTFTVPQVRAEPFATNTALGRYTQFANLLDLAVVSVPFGASADGRPVGVSFIGPAWSDALLARLAREVLERGGAAEGVAEVATAPAAAGVVAEPVEGEPAEAEPAEGEMLLAVVGHHLRHGSRNHELVARGGRLVEATSTASCYRLYALGSGERAVPALVRSSVGGGSIEVELWALPAATVGSLLAGIAAPLSLGRVRLRDGREITGFLGEAYALSRPDAIDITASGGWRAYSAAREPAIALRHPSPTPTC